MSGAKCYKRITVWFLCTGVLGVWNWRRIPTGGTERASGSIYACPETINNYF